MPRPCSTCSRPDVDEIDAAIAAGGSQRKIAAQFGTTDSAIRRHKDHSGDAAMVSPTSSPSDGPGRLRLAADALIAEVKARAGVTYTAQDHAEAEYLCGVADLADANPTSVSAQREFRQTIAGFRAISDAVGVPSDEELDLVRSITGNQDLTARDLRPQG